MGLMSIRCRMSDKSHAIEALRRAGYKIPGKQKICIAKEWGFTKFTHEEYEKYAKQGRLVKQGAHDVWRRAHGPLARAGDNAVLSYELERKSIIESNAKKAAAEAKAKALAKYAADMKAYLASKR